MNKKILKFILISILVTVLMAGDFILLGHGVAIAMYEELETQNTTTNIKNVEFDSYFLDNGNKTHSKRNSLTQNEKLILNINVKEEGVLNDAKIKIENTNFEILKDQVQNSYVKNINLETNEIELNQVIYGNNVIIEIPIKFKKQNNFEEDYFEKENIISLTGKYVKGESEGRDVTGQIKIRMIWAEEVDVALSQDVEKYVNLGVEGILLQESIITEVTDNRLPRKSETIETIVPMIEGVLPESVIVIKNGEKLLEDKVIYDKDNKKLIISEDTSGTWKNARNEYKVIYNYKNIEFKTQEIELSSNMTTTLYTQATIQKADAKIVTLEEKGSSVSIAKTATGSIYKGYMYANAINGTNYTERNKIEISETNTVEGIEIERADEIFEDGNGSQFTIGENLIYKSTTLYKSELERIFGQDYIITITDMSGNILHTITKNIEDENGVITVSYDGDVSGIKVKTSKPVSEGTFYINNTRSIEGNSGYEKDSLKQFTLLKTQTKATANKAQNPSIEIGEAITTLEDTRTEATLTLNKSSWSSLKTNEGVQLVVLLKNNSEQYDLYKNPTIKIEIPDYIEEMKVNSIKKLYDDELTVEEAKMGIENGKRVIILKLTGEQTKYNDSALGTQIVINSDITLKKDIPTSSQELVFSYSNDNSAQGNYQTTVPVKFESKYGMMVYTKINQSDSEEVIESIDNRTIDVGLKIQDEMKTIDIERTLINNYEIQMNDVQIIGNLSDEKNTFKTNLTAAIEVNREDVTVYYSTKEAKNSSDMDWQEGIENIKEVKAYKIVFNEGKIDNGQTLKINYQIAIPSGLEYNQYSQEGIEVNYSYQGQELSDSFYTQFNTELVNQSKEEIELINENDTSDYQTIEGIGKVKIVATSAGKVLEDGEQIYEGQTIKYTVIVLNDTAQDLQNLSIVAKHDNAIFYDIKVEREQNTATFEEMDFTTIIQNPDLQQKEYNAEILKVGEFTTFEYEFVAKQNVGGNTKGTITIQGNGNETTIDTISNEIVDAKLQIIAAYGHYEESLITATSAFSTRYEVTNISEENLNDVILDVNISENCKLREDLIAAYEDEAGTSVDIELLSNNDKIAKIKISAIESGKTVNVSTTFDVIDMPADVLTKDITISASATIGEENYVSNIVEKQIHQDQTDIVITQVGSIEKDTVKTGDELIYKAIIENKGLIEDNLIIADEVPSAAVIQNVYYIKNNEKIEVAEEDILNNSIGFIETLQPGEKIELYIETIIDEQRANEETITNIITASGKTTLVESNKVTYKINMPVQSQNSISGIAWVDENKDGERQGNEQVMKNMIVVLLDTKQNEVKSTTTNEKGAYTFSDLSNGTYIVAFKYDTTKYYLTEYQKQDVEAYLNSDVITKEINGEQFAVTDLLNIENNYVTADAGFIESQIFDMKLDKLVSKITLQSNSKTSVYSYNNTKLAKIELKAKNINNSKVTIEYQIKITNEGEIAGYVEDIIDYLPAGMTLEDKNWTLENTNELHNRILAQQEIAPGETKEVTLTLTKTLTPEDTGTIINIAEIGRASNVMLITDIDSIPNNKAEKEDDLARADVIISVSTGITTIISVGAVILILVLTGITIYYLRKRGKNSNE